MRSRASLHGRMTTFPPVTRAPYDRDAAGSFPGSPLPGPAGRSPLYWKSDHVQCIDDCQRRHAGGTWHRATQGSIRPVQTFGDGWQVRNRTQHLAQCRAPQSVRRAPQPQLTSIA
ncbi:hypothetical protein G6F59_016765 [Rhizopus arrhizus]|nr:hypothetical protein G6F59_016765 [Rhizopus arrhizus]